MTEGTAAPVGKPIREINGSELRAMGRDDRHVRQQEARRELGRRKRNMRGALIPDWEYALRGRRVEDWAIV